MPHASHRTEQERPRAPRKLSTSGLHGGSYVHDTSTKSLGLPPNDTPAKTSFPVATPESPTRPRVAPSVEKPGASVDRRRKLAVPRRGSRCSHCSDCFLQLLQRRSSTDPSSWTGPCRVGHHRPQRKSAWPSRSWRTSHSPPSTTTRTPRRALTTFAPSACMTATMSSPTTRCRLWLNRCTRRSSTSHPQPSRAWSLSRSSGHWRPARPTTWSIPSPSEPYTPWALSSAASSMERSSTPTAALI